MDNMLRGLYRDNSDSTLTNTLAQTVLKSVSIAANTIGATGGFRVIACGTISGTNGTKTMRLQFGSTTIATITQAAGTTSDWFIDAWCFNTSASGQRWFVQRNTNDALTSSFDYASSIEDTSANRTLQVNGQLGNVGDTVVCTLMDVFVVQIT